MGLSSFEPEAALLEAGTGVGLNIEQCLVGPNGQNCDRGERLVCTDLQVRHAAKLLCASLLHCAVDRLY